MKPIVSCALFLACVCNVSAAGIYKWVDEHGKVHYGDRPGTASSQQMDIESQTGAPSSGGASYEERLEKQRRLLDAYQTEREEKRAEARKAQELKQQRKRNCTIARDRLRAIGEAGYLYDVDESGKRRVFSDAQRKAATRRARNDVEKWCD